MSPSLEKLRDLLKELFQLDQAELDFGIYRIMNTRREEITRFLDNDLLPQVREVLSTYERESRGSLEAELEKAKEQAKALGFDDPAQAPKVKELQSATTPPSTSRPRRTKFSPTSTTSSAATTARATSSPNVATRRAFTPSPTKARK